MFFFLLCTYGFTYYHELAHVNIFRNFGVESEVDYGIFKATTTAINGTCNDYCKLAQSNVEAVGYNIQGAILFFIVGIVAIFLMFLLSGALDD
jgi:hypothetical protein